MTRIYDKINQMISKDKDYEIVIPGPDNVDYASQVSALIDQAIARGSTLLPKTRKQILGLFEEGSSVLAMDGSTVLAHVAITVTYPNGDLEVGGMVSKEGRKGLAKRTTLEVVNLAKRKFPGQRVIALANEQGALVLENLHARRLEQSELHPDFLLPCFDCPRRPAGIERGKPFKCCDTAYELTNIYES